MIRSATLMLTLSALCWAGSLDKMKDDLEATPQVLRGFPEGGKLKYDVHGELLKLHPGTWTVNGLVSIDGWELKGNELRIRANRLVALYDNKSQKPEFRKYKERVELRMPYVDDAQAEVALRRLFILQPEKLSAHVPPVWQRFLEKEAKLKDSNQPNKDLQSDKQPVEDPLKRKCKTPEDGVYRICEGITPPIPQYRPEPEFSQFARRFGIQGNVTIVGVVDVNGRMRDLEIEKALGAGLDEAALEAVSRWTFKPSKKDGVPIPVKIMVDVDFHLF